MLSSAFQPTANLQGNHVIDKEDVGSDSPRSAVAGYLGHLEIYEDALRPQSQSRPTATDSDSPFPSQMDGDKSPTMHITSPSPCGELLGNNTPLPGTDPERDEVHPPAQKKGRACTSPTSSPKAKRSCTPQPAFKRRSKSPPLRSNSEDNPLTWSDSEITGHLGTDPNDDGYGINGLGFKPTPAVAWARSERRKRQIAEWKNREASEARLARRERRGIGGESKEGHQETMNPSHKKVKFEA